MKKYPCKNCIVNMTCNEIECPQLEIDEDNIVKHFNDYNNCPDCGGIKFHVDSDISEVSGDELPEILCVNCYSVFKFMPAFGIDRDKEPFHKSFLSMRQGKSRCFKIFIKEWDVFEWNKVPKFINEVLKNYKWDYLDD